MKAKLISLLASSGVVARFDELERIARELIDNGVTVEPGCERCRGSAKMLVAITNEVKDPNAKSKWIGGHLPARYCPFCGRKLGG